MTSTKPMKYRKSHELRSERERLVARRDRLRREYAALRAAKASDEVLAHLVKDGTSCNANVALIDRELHRRRRWAQARSVTAHVAPEQPEAEASYDEPLGQPSWDDLHLAVGTWS